MTDAEPIVNLARVIEALMAERDKLQREGDMDTSGNITYTTRTDEGAFKSKEFARVNADGQVFINWEVVDRVTQDNDPKVNAFAKVIKAVRDGTAQPLK
jgi:hypothetical protein